MVAYLIGHTVSNELKKQTDYLFSLLIFLVSPVDKCGCGHYNLGVRPDDTLLNLVGQTLLTTLKGEYMRQTKISLLAGLPDSYYDTVRQIEQYREIANARSTYISNNSYGNSNGSSHAVKTAASVVDVSLDSNGADAGATVAASDDDDDGGDGDSESDRRKSSNKHTPKTVISRPIKSLPDSGFIRLPQVLSTIPVSKSTWWAGIKLGKYPAGIKLSERVTAWRVEDIRALITQLASNAS